MHIYSYDKESVAMESFVEMLDEQGPIIILGLEYMPSYVLGNVDPIAFRTAFLDYFDTWDE